MVIPLNPKDILVPDTIVEVIISRKLIVKQKAKRKYDQLDNP